MARPVAQSFDDIAQLKGRNNFEEPSGSNADETSKDVQLKLTVMGWPYGWKENGETAYICYATDLRHSGAFFHLDWF